MDKRILEMVDTFERELCIAGINRDNIDYDILTKSRQKLWKKIENHNFLTKKMSTKKTIKTP